MKILNVDLYTQTLLWFVTSCTNWLELFSLFGGKWDLPPNKLKISSRVAQLVTNHNKVCVYKSTFKIFISIYIHQ